MLQKLLRRVRGKGDSPADTGGQRRGFRGEDLPADAAEQAGRAGGSFAADAAAKARPTPDRDADETPTPRES